MESQNKGARGLTFRALTVALVALLLQAVWISYAERYDTYGAIAENSPPLSAVAVMLVVMTICGGLALLRRKLRLCSAELVVVYAALVVAAPLMSQGLWGRMAGLLAAVPNNGDFRTLDSMPSRLWPHGPNLVENGRFEHDLEGFTVRGTHEWEQVDAGRFGTVRALVMEAEDEQGAELSFVLPRYAADGREILIPGERHLFSLLMRVQGLLRGSTYTISLSTDDKQERLLYVSTAETHATFTHPGGFERMGVTPVAVPLELEKEMRIIVRLTGSGRVALYDVEFMNIEAVEAIYSGRNVVKTSEYAALGPDERANLVQRPDNLISPSGLRYLATGFIPLRQWVQPAVAWTLLIGAMFAGFLGFNLLMRRQWVESERFTFPLTVVPRRLFEQTESGGWAIWRNRTMWLGFGLTMVVALLRGLNHYNPAIPELGWHATPLAPLVENPLAKAYLSGVTVPGLCLTILAIGLLIQTDILFSLWACYFLYQLWYLAGPALNMNRYPGYPWRFQQSMGAFIAYAMLALFVGRRHIIEAFKLAFSTVAAARGREAEAREHRVSIALIILSFVVLAWWGWWTGMGVRASLLFFGYMMILGFATSKIRAECGTPGAYLTPYHGMQFVAATGGFAMFGPTGMLVATIASGFMTVACFLLIAPVQVEMLELGRRFKVSTRQVSSGLWLGLMAGILLGGFVVLCWAYGFGGDSVHMTWQFQQYWNFNGYRAAELAIDRAMSTGELVKPETACMNIFANPDAKGLAIGAIITIVLAVLRSMFMWFPLHPLGYVLAGSHLMVGAGTANMHGGFWLPALLAWLIRGVVLKLGGARAIREQLTPFCVGMFLAAVSSMVFFDVVGLILRCFGVADVYNGVP